MIAQGVTISSGVTVYTSSGLGPSVANKAAPEGGPESYIDSQFSGGALPPGVTLTDSRTNLGTGDAELVPPSRPRHSNATPPGPARFAVEVGGLPVPGWLVEVEVEAVYPTDSAAG